MMIHEIAIWEFYTETESGVETIVSTKTLKYPKKSTEWKKLKSQGFTNGVFKFGFRVQAAYKNNQK